MSNNTISNEVISIDVTREFGKLIEAQVEKIRRSWTDYRVIDPDMLRELSDIVKHTGLNVKFISTPGVDAWMMTWNYAGHQGTGFSQYWRADMTPKVGLKEVAKVDLKNLTVSGPMVDRVKFTCNIGQAFYNEAQGWTTKEVTGILLHECGHAFNVFTTLGDYIYLNYMLADGIDVVLGNKRNEFQLEVLDATWLAKNIPVDQRDQFANHRSPDVVKRAILSAWKKAPRHYLFDNPATALKREEQMADMFATRLGYGKALASGLHRLYKTFGAELDNSSSWLGLIAKLMLAVTFIPFTVLWLVFSTGASEMNGMDLYDNPQERINKIRKDLIFQLKHISDNSLKDGIAEDIKAVEDILAEYNLNRTFFDKLQQFFTPSLRREQALMKHEENLEDLMNNPLFVDAYRYKNA
jgi:hypothetical protein